MKGSRAIIDLLNDVLSAELTAVHQYLLHAKMAQNWGYERMHEKLREESAGEMKDAEALIARILYLEGAPDLQRLGTVEAGQSLREQLGLDHGIEKAAIARLNAGIATARAEGDNGTRELLETILVGEEEHARWIEAQLALVAQVGEANYLAQQIEKDG